ncbi:hypothetical protein [Streptomyces coeruleorubidus]|uniref:hypothetical protein n=1 Tax=Streptomyces coeruleorubidus TaxID=116188 RepID=UPI00142EE5ED|nr:hypothetical protein [Streptomyces coeruleorubidus]GGU05811.1 hypothetical protein GCM10010256_77160 [Streptomyces coeruleorubidus]
MNHEEAARKLGVDPASLSPAPPAPRFAQTWARMQQEPPCFACGRPSRTSGVLHDRDHGPRWLDPMPRVLPRHTAALRVPPARFLAELRAVAADGPTNAAPLRPSR